MGLGSLRVGTELQQGGAKMLERKLTYAYAAALVCTVSLVVLVATVGANAKPVSYSTGSFVASCDTTDSTPQICDPPTKLKVRVNQGKVRIKRVHYVASTEHCSAARVLVSLDGAAIGHTAYVNAGEQAIVDDLKLTLDQGRHKFKFRVQGRVGGCNTGFVGSWGGKITLTGKKRSG
jgi:hypothetical protein